MALFNEIQNWNFKIFYQNKSLEIKDLSFVLLSERHLVYITVMKGIKVEHYLSEFDTKLVSRLMKKCRSCQLPWNQSNQKTNKIVSFF